MTTKAEIKAAADQASTALETIARLNQFEGVRGMTLTDNQENDRTAARVRWNEAAAVVGLPRMSPTEPPTEAWVDRAVDRLRLAHQGIELDDAIRSRIGDIDDAGSGSSGNAPTADPIREMLTSGERQHDFDFPETEAIRSLPRVTVEDEGVRAISDFGNGSSLFVSDFAARVAAYARTVSPWIGLATVVTSDNGRPLIVPTLTGDVVVYSPGEGTAITPSDPTLGTVTVSPSGFKALTYLSRESWDDEEINLTDILARSHARAIGLAFGSSATTTVLAGINNGGTASGTGGNGTAASAFFGYEDLIDLQYSRAAPYRLIGNWIMHNGSIKKTRKFKDQQGQYLWPSSNAVSGQPPTFMGGGVYEDPYLAAPASATKSLIYGDAAAGLVIKATQLRVETSKDFLFSTDQVAIKTVQRIQIAVQDPAALAYLVSANT